MKAPELDVYADLNWAYRRWDESPFLSKRLLNRMNLAKK